MQPKSLWLLLAAACETVSNGQIQKVMVEAMVRLEKALAPQIERLLG